jgi:transcription elongation factor Elf1
VNPNGVARRLRALAEHHSSTVLMETVVCGKCGQRFAIQHDPALQDVELARKQASWVTDQLVWDHIQERKHHGLIDLPKLH